MASLEYGVNDFRCVAAGAAILASGGGGSYSDAVHVLDELENRGWAGPVAVQPYDGATSACVLALMGSPDAADALTLGDVERAIAHIPCEPSRRPRPPRSVLSYPSKSTPSTRLFL